MTFRFVTNTFLAALLLVVGACSEGGRPGEQVADDHEDEATGEPHVEKQGAEAHDEGLVELSAGKIESAGIETATVSLGSLPALLSTTGQVDFDQDRLAHVSPRIPGRVHEVRARLGQRVRKGETLAVLDSIELGRAKAEYLQSKAREQLARENLKREEDLYADRISSEKEMLVARAARIETEAARKSAEEILHLYGLNSAEVSEVTYENPGQSLFAVRAPLTGKIIEKHTTVGELVAPERNLFSLADLSVVWVWIDVYERDLQQVHVDDRADVRVEAFPELEFTGHVSYLSDQVDVDTRRIRARIDVENPGERLRPGMFARVELSDPHQETPVSKQVALVMPQSAVQRDGDSTVAFIALGEGRFERREVQIGRAAGGLVEVLGGLSAGETVVSQGGFFLKSEMAKDELGEGHGH